MTATRPYFLSLNKINVNNILYLCQTTFIDDVKVLYTFLITRDLKGFGIFYSEWSIWKITLWRVIAVLLCPKRVSLGPNCYVCLLIWNVRDRIKTHPHYNIYFNENYLMNVITYMYVYDKVLWKVLFTNVAVYVIDCVYLNITFYLLS